MLEKYFYRFQTPVEKQRVRAIKEKEIVVPKLTLHDDRKPITTMEERKLLETCMPAHNLASYARKVTAILLPKVDIAFDILLWDRKELRHGVQLLSTNSSDSH